MWRPLSSRLKDRTAMTWALGTQMLSNSVWRMKRRVKRRIIDWHMVFHDIVDMRYFEDLWNMCCYDMYISNISIFAQMEKQVYDLQICRVWVRSVNIVISRCSLEVHMNFIECTSPPSNFAHSSGEGCSYVNRVVAFFQKPYFWHAVPSLSKKQYLEALILG